MSNDLSCLSSLTPSAPPVHPRGMRVREIQRYLEWGVALAGLHRSPMTVTEEVRVWDNRPLEQYHRVVFFDALRIKIRDEGTVKNKAGRSKKVPDTFFSSPFSPQGNC